MAARRYWIERSFEDAKSELGMAQYQVRSWRGWHHHMALVLMASLFMVRFRINHSEEQPLLSAADIRMLLEHFLPRRAWTTQDLLDAMESRHRLRAADTARCTRRRARKRAVGSRRPSEMPK
jgi:hypothetical protein